jgi:uncharacterized protein (TIGR00369 family)
MSTSVRTIPLDAASRREFENQWNSSKAIQHLGISIALGDDDLVRVKLDPVLEYHRGGLGTAAVNGVVMSGLCDLAVGIVGVLNGGGERVGTASLGIQFVRPLNGNKAIAEGRLVRAGSTMIFARVEIKDEKGVVCVTCDGIVGVTRKKIDQSESKNPNF